MVPLPAAMALPEAVRPLPSYVFTYAHLTCFAALGLTDLLPGRGSFRSRRGYQAVPISVLFIHLSKCLCRIYHLNDINPILERTNWKRDEGE